MTINYYIKNVYGNELMYVADHKQFLTVAALTKQTTLSHTAISALEELGLKFKQVLPPKKDEE